MAMQSADKIARKFNCRLLPGKWEYSIIMAEGRGQCLRRDERVRSAWRMRVIALHTKVARGKSWNVGPLRGSIRMPTTVAGKSQSHSHYRKATQRKTASK